MDEYFPEYEEAFKCPLSGKASRHLLKICSFPKFILELGEDGVMEKIKKAAKKTVGRKKAMQLIEAAEESIGADYGEESARLKLRLMLEELELLEKQTEELERQISDALHQTDYADFLLSIKEIGVVTLAACLGELGAPTRFEVSRQMSCMAGYNLVKDRSGKNKSGTKISKRGRKSLRNILYQMALTMVATNDEMK